jgi:hypothetical protein
MDIVLDSNIFRSDFNLHSTEFNVILDYLQKTQSTIVLPQIILDEVKGLYSRVLTERIVKLNSNINNFNLLMIDEGKAIDKIEINIADEVENYAKYLTDKLKIENDKIIPVNNNYLPNLVERAVKRLRPSADGEGFRDALIWLTLKDYCLKCHEKQVIFISNNDADFGDAGKNELHPLLKQECDELKIKVNYFRTIKDFIEKHSTKIDFITYDWVRDNFSNEWLEDIIMDELNGRQPSSVVSWYSGETGNSCTGYFRAKKVYPDSQDDMSIYEMADNILIVNLVFCCSVEIEFEIYNEEVMRRSEYEYSPHSRTTTSFDKTTMGCSAYVSLTVKNGEIDEVELNDLSY